MRAAHTVATVREAEAALMARLPDGTLMQRAAGGLAVALAGALGGCYGRRVLLVVGSGDNGGDALWAGARLAARGAQVEAVLLAGDRTHAAGLAGLRAAGGRVVTATTAARPELIVDGIVGIGGRGPLRESAVAALDLFPEVPVVAVDVPSGVEVDTGEIAGAHVRAALTVTFGTYKIAHLVDPAAAACGQVHLVDIGLELPPAPVAALEAGDLAALLRAPKPDAHKYTRGVVGLRTGSPGYPGAAVLSVAGANCGLAGMIRYDGGAAADVRAAHPEVVVGPGRVQAWVVGSGGGPEAHLDLDSVRGAGVPIVVDADALAHLDGPPDVPAVLTPHAGELAGMLAVSRTEIEARPLEHVREAADRFGSVVLLKGRRTLVAEPLGRVCVNTTGTPWLATAGSGDVLAGLIGALLATGLGTFDAAAAGAWLHGAAGEKLRGPVTAGGLAGELPVVIGGLLSGETIDP